MTNFDKFFFACGLIVIAIACLAIVFIVLGAGQ